MIILKKSRSGFDFRSCIARDEPRQAKFEACQIMRALNCFVVDILSDVPLSIPDRSLVISVSCEIARIVKMPRAIILFSCPKENRYILGDTTNLAGLRKADTMARDSNGIPGGILPASERPPNADRYIAHRYLWSLRIAYDRCIKYARAM